MHIFSAEEELIEAFIISVDEASDIVTDEEFYTMIEMLLTYYSAVNKHLTKEAILNKIKMLDGKGEKSMTIPINIIWDRIN